MKRRLISTAIDLFVLLLFSVGVLAVLENASGLLFSFYFIDEQSFTRLHELVIYDFLYRYYGSEIAKKKYSKAI